MGQKTIKIQRIEKVSNRRVTFNKRRIGLLKKAYEISVLCEVDIALIFFSQNGDLTCFEGSRSSIEEVVMKFANTPEQERAKGHIQKYATIEDQMENTMPRKIQNEEIFQEVAQKLYQCRPKSNSSLEYDRANQLQLCHRAVLAETMREIQDIQSLLGFYDLNIPIGNLVSSDDDAAQMEIHIHRQLQKIRNLKAASSQLSAPWLDSQKKPVLKEDNEAGWDAFSSDMEVLFGGGKLTFSEDTNIQDDRIAHDFLEDIKAHDSLQKAWEQEMS